MSTNSDVLLNELLGWFEPDTTEAGVVQPAELERLALRLADRLEAERLRQDKPESRDPYPTTVAYGGGEYGGPRDVYVNGQRVQAVQKITVEHEVDQFSKVTIVLGGVLVSVSPKVEL